MEKIFGKADKRNPEELFQVTITDDFVTVEHPKAKTKTVKWTDIEEVRVINTDDDPDFTEVWIELVGKNDRCSIPQGAEGYNEVFEVVSGYDGFDAMNYIKVMGSADNEERVLWRRPQ
ncbi:MAG TPA: hypothetical protein PKE06_12415 [Flavilitoribacter sp.]|nr:hypothetical protein [Flavilitoribacter sp.]HMQ87839.1 hypothetical protein [Flavilitoribacter sp.]